MRLIAFGAFAVALMACGSREPGADVDAHRGQDRSVDSVTVNYDMADAGMRWLELVAAGADGAALREAFFRNVAPTAGCQAIIRHWERFRDWNEELFLDFILEALDCRATDAPLVDEHGRETRLGHARRLWLAAVAHQDELRENLEALRSIDVRQVALDRARRFLPAGADVSNRFHVVLFGASGAFSVGEDNGFDLLQLKRLPNGEIDVEWVIDLFAHEMHHSGLASAMERSMGVVADDDRIVLPGVLVAEGMATYFTTPPFPQLEAWRVSDDPTDLGLAADWDRHFANMPSLYAQAEADIELGLDGGLITDDLMTRWLDGYQGPAYGLGVDMMRIIDTELGTDAAVNLARDSRRLLTTYNRAAVSARAAGREAYLFNAALAERLEAFEPADSKDVSAP
jgi:hypothetical protein